MSNQNSKAGHIPMRSCVVCKKKQAKEHLLSFILLPAGIVFDLQGRLPMRKYYVCPQPECLTLLAKWRKKRLKGRRS
ncbi:MAG: uncharacterized protein PWP64_1062 [Candidatus Cloacimonadota bacterium]|nr:uncharacterized protein [Candidatus Cloacimonadota bacterium]